MYAPAEGAITKVSTEWVGDFSSADVALRGSPRTALSDLNRHRPPAGCEVVCDGPEGFARNHRADISSHRAAVLVFSGVRTVRDQDACAAAWAESISRSFLGHFVEKSPSLLPWKK